MLYIRTSINNKRNTINGAKEEYKWQIKKGLSRRDFLKTTGIATGALVGGGVLGSLITHNVTKEKVAGPRWY